MAVEAITTVAAKEVAVEAAKEAAIQAAREIAQKAAMEAAGTSGRSEIQTAMLERQTMQEGFRIGEMPESKGEGREALKEKETAAAEELRGKFDSEEIHDGENETKPIHYDLITRNSSLEGDVHPITGVGFERKEVIDAEGNVASGVFPKFESIYDAQLPSEMLKASDKVQFTECCNQLKNAISKDPELAKKFNNEQLEQIRSGDTPDGYVWHHNEELGKMQLVDIKIHEQTGHNGGRSLWGGGNELR